MLWGIHTGNFIHDFAAGCKLYAPDKAIKGLITLKKANLLTKENAKVLENQHDPEGAALLLVKMQEAKINITETLINEIKNNLSPTYLAQLIILNTTNMPNNVADKDENKQVTKVKKGLAKITNYYDFSKNQSPPDNITPISFKKK